MLSARPQTLPAGIAQRMSLMKAPRPLSTATEIFDTDVEDGGDDGPEESADDSSSSEFEEFFMDKRSFESDDSRRRSQTTLSSYDEATTPDCSREAQPFDLQPSMKPVEGPRGPHLFRSSSSSAELAFEHALQMSPLIPIKLDLEPSQPWKPQSLLRTSHQPQADRSIQSTINEDEDPHNIIRRWTPAQVTDWMTSWDLDTSVIRCFEKHDITGAVLLDLQFEDLRELDIESFGKRHQLWSAICVLRGDEEASPRQDSSRPGTRNTMSRSTSRREASVSSGNENVDATPASATAERKARRGRKGSKNVDTIHPGESVSIVAIEQLLPKPHSCAKGEDCPKWQKQQQHIRQLQQGNELGCFPISPTKHHHVRLPTRTAMPPTMGLKVPPARAVSEIATPRTAVPMSEASPLRPTSEVVPSVVASSEVVPSVVASSDLLGPGQYPDFTLHAETLEKLDKRDPQDNVRNFLRFQHMHSPGMPPTPPAELTDVYSLSRSQSVPPTPQMFPAQHHQAYPSLSPPNGVPTQTPDERLRGLPKLEIPRAATAPSEETRRLNTLVSPQETTICRNATASPTQIYRLGTPASEMDVPVTAIPVGPVSRDHSQSVPPNMHYRQPTQSPRSAVSHRAQDWRRPSLPAVREGEIFSPATGRKPGRPSMSTNSSMDSSSSVWSSPEKKSTTVSDPAHHSPVTHQFGYGSDCSHAGWMKKRKTKLLRHEWQDAHCRLMGTQLHLHASARLSAARKDSINVDDYAVACASLPSNSKLSAAMRGAFHLRSADADGAAAAGGAAGNKDADPAAFAFQLVPNRESAAGRKFSAPSLAKTHHFAVKSKDDRIDWMREIMIAKALQQRGKGYDVEVNGVQA